MIALAGGLLTVAVAAQLWTIPHHAPWRQANPEISYTKLAEAFIHGQLSLLQQPDPRLLALPDPYDGKANTQYALNDASLFDGKYYFYWGPFPGLLTAIVCLAMGISHPTFGDQGLLLLFRVGTVVMAAILVLDLRRRFFAKMPAEAAAVAIASLGLGAPLLCTYGTTLVYEAEIAGGQCMLLCGLCAAWFHLATPRRGSIRLLIAGLCWTFAAGSRVSLAPAIAAVVLCTLWQIRGNWRGSGTLVAPLVMGAAMYGWYNAARFGSAFDFGWHYQLSVFNQHAVSRAEFFSPAHAIPNLVSYLLAAPIWLKRFPFVWAGTPFWVDFLFSHRSIRYNVSPLVGLVWSQPFLFLAPLGMIHARWAALPLRWLLASLALATLLGGAPSLMIRSTIMRYFMDMVPCCTILAFVGYSRLLERLEQAPKLRREVASAVRLIVAWQCVLGLLLTFQM